MEDHPGVVDTDNSIPSDPGTSSARALVIRQVIKDNLGNKYHNNSKSSYFVDTDIRDGDNNKEVVIENIDGDSNVAGNGENIALVDDGGDDIPWPGAKLTSPKVGHRCVNAIFFIIFLRHGYVLTYCSIFSKVIGH